MKIKSLLISSLTLFVSIISMAQGPQDQTDIYNANGTAFPSSFTFTGTPIIATGLYARLGINSSCIFASTQSNVLFSSSQTVANLNVTITGPGRFTMSNLACNNMGANVVENITVFDASFAFTQKPAATVTFNGINLVYNIVTTSTSASMVVLSLDEDINTSQVQLTGNSLTVTGLGSFSITATQNNVDYFYNFNVITASGVVASTPGNNTSTPGANVSATVSGLNSSASLSNIVNAVLVSIVGNNFQNGASVTIGGVVLTNVAINGNLITGTIPAGSTVLNPSNPTIIVQNPGASASAPVSLAPVIGNPTNVNESLIINNLQLIINPNPSSGTFTIKSNEIFSENEIKVTDLIGNNVSFTLVGNELTISKSGIYFVNFSGKVVKVIVL